MAEEPNLNASAELRLASADESAANPARIDMREVFRQLILDEIRRGGLTKSRRRRIIQYAAHLNLTAVEVGKMITACREELLAGDDQDASRMALTMVHHNEQSDTDASPWAMFGMFTLRGLTIGLWLVAGLLLLTWLMRA